MPSYSEYVAYSPSHDCEMCRLSMWDDQGGEHWLFVRPYGKGWADQRKVCTLLLLEHIETKKPAGEVESPSPEYLREMVLELQGIRNAAQKVSVEESRVVQYQS